MKLLILAAFLASLAVSGADFPQAEISNGQIHATILLPDPDKGYYRGTRFDWSGVVASLEYKGHQFAGQWFEHYDPKLHDAILGPVEEFRSSDGGLGYGEAKAGGTFIRIGVGVVRKPEEPAYQLFNTYEIVDSGRWTTRRGKDWIEFTQRLSGPDGYSYVYSKTLKLARGEPDLLIEHRLKNTGRKTIETSQYNHNFFVIDHQVTGPDISVRFAFAPKPSQSIAPLAEIKANDLVYPKPLEKGQSVFSEMTGFDPGAAGYEFHIENRASHAGVQIRGDRPLEKVLFWSIRTVACPEPYIHLRVEPGQETRWTITDSFYTF